MKLGVDVNKELGVKNVKSGKEWEDRVWIHERMQWINVNSNWVADVVQIDEFGWKLQEV